MRSAVSISANNDSSEPIRKLWVSLSRFESAPSMAELRYTPHITLAIYDSIDPFELHRSFGDIFERTKRLRVTFNTIEYFSGSPTVLWASPVEKEILYRLHSEVHKRIDPNECDAHYRPGRWVPHCTLAMNVTDSCRSDALNSVADTDLPIQAVFDAVDYVTFPPVQVAVRQHLT